MLPAFKKLRLSRAESRDQQRWMPKPWYELRWENHWRPEKSWDEPRRGEPGWDQMRWDEMSRDELRETTSTCSFWRRSLRTLRFHSLNLTCSLWRDLDLARKYCFSTTLTCSFWRRSCAKASFSQPQLTVFEANLLQKLRFYNFNFNSQSLKEILHGAFAFATSMCSCWRRSRTKASFSQLQLAGNVKGKETKSKRCQESRGDEKSLAELRRVIRE